MSDKRAQPPFTVQRHGGRSGDEWRTVGTFDTEDEAIAKYKELRRDMRQGGVVLCDSRGITLLKNWRMK